MTTHTIPASKVTPGMIVKFRNGSATSGRIGLAVLRAGWFEDETQVQLMGRAWLIGENMSGYESAEAVLWADDLVDVISNAAE